MQEEDQIRLQNLEEDQKILMASVITSYENMNILLQNQKEKFENEDIVISNQSKIITNQDIIVTNQLNIINNQKLIVQNQVTLQMILKLQSHLLKLMKKTSSSDSNDDQIASEVNGIIEEARKEFENEQQKMYTFQNNPRSAKE
jgi:hypothetical protein